MPSATSATAFSSDAVQSPAAPRFAVDAHGTSPTPQRAADRNVHAVGVGRKMVNGKPTGERCVRIYVVQKVPKKLISKKALLPTSIDGVPTDVIESLPAFANLPAPVAACSVKRRERQRPLQAGISAGHEEITAGTIGYFFRSTDPADDRKKLLVLSNNHVFADVDNADLGDAILQPGPLDGGVAGDRIATLHRAQPIDLDGGANFVDAAVGLLRDGVAAKMEICSIGRVTGSKLPTEGLRVRKHGRTSGLTFGEIVDTSVDAIVGMDHDDPTVKGVFVDQLRIEVRPPSSAIGLGGDSGSLVITTRGRRAVGLYFAGPASGAYGLASPIAAVLEALAIKFV
jgi:hypothetical protein